MIAVTGSSDFSVVSKCPNCDKHDWLGIQRMRENRCAAT
jgi:hypothetical protein